MENACRWKQFKNLSSRRSGKCEEHLFSQLNLVAQKLLQRGNLVALLAYFMECENIPEQPVAFSWRLFVLFCSRKGLAALLKYPCCEMMQQQLKAQLSHNLV